jgi:hypothetical protein
MPSAARRPGVRAGVAGGLKRTAARPPECRVWAESHRMGSIKGKKRGPYKQRAGEVQLTTDGVVAVLREECGSIFHTALALGITRSRLTNYMERHKPCMQAWKEAHDNLGDVAERKLHELIMAGDVRCILWYLATKHAHRGYGKADAEATEQFGESRQMHVSTVNIISIPNGHYLSREQARAFTVDMVPLPTRVSNDHVNGDRSDDSTAGIADAAERDAHPAAPEQSSIFD